MTSIEDLEKRIDTSLYLHLKCDEVLVLKEWLEDKKAMEKEIADLKAKMEYIEIIGQDIWIRVDELYHNAEQKALSEFETVIRQFDNPYPKDVFLWDSNEKLDFNRGRFNRHCFEVVESTRNAILKWLKEMVK